MPPATTRPRPADNDDTLIAFLDERGAGALADVNIGLSTLGDTPHH